MDKKTYAIHTKIWIEDDHGQMIFGEGQLKILETIDNEGSISAAAKEMKMGYRSMWGKLKKMEQRLGRQVLIRKKGGSSGGESILTSEAKTLIAKFRHIQQKIALDANNLLKDIDL
ncbi:winged helix-turn-helix domain-containing protein [Desulfocicer niacini]